MSKKEKATIAPKNYKIVNKLQSQPKKREHFRLVKNKFDKELSLVKRES